MSSENLDYPLPGLIADQLFQGHDDIPLDAELAVMLNELDVSLHDATV